MRRPPPLPSWSAFFCWAAVHAVLRSANAAVDNGGRPHHRRGRRLAAPTCTGSRIDASRARAVHSTTDVKVQELLGRDIEIDNNDGSDSDPIASALRTLLGGSPAEPERRYRSHGPTRIAWANVKERTDPIACFQRYREYIGDAYVAGSELNVRTDCGSNDSNGSASASASAPEVSTDAEQDASARSEKTGLFHKRRRKTGLFGPLRAVLAGVRSYSSSPGGSRPTIPGVAQDNVGSAGSVRILSITGKTIVGSLSQEMKMSVTPSISRRDASRVLTSVLDLESDPIDAKSGANQGSILIELQLAATVDGDRLVYAASDGMSTAMVDAHTEEVVLHCKAVERNVERKLVGIEVKVSTCHVEAGCVKFVVLQ